MGGDALGCVHICICVCMLRVVRAPVRRRVFFFGRCSWNLKEAARSSATVVSHVVRSVSRFDEARTVVPDASARAMKKEKNRLRTLPADDDVDDDDVDDRPRDGARASRHVTAPKIHHHRRSASVARFTSIHSHTRSHFVSLPFSLSHTHLLSFFLSLSTEITTDVGRS